MELYAGYQFLKLYQCYEEKNAKFRRVFSYVFHTYQFDAIWVTHVQNVRSGMANISAALHAEVNAQPRKINKTREFLQ